MVAQHVLEIMNIYRVLSSTSNYLGDEIYLSLSLSHSTSLTHSHTLTFAFLHNHMNCKAAAYSSLTSDLEPTRPNKQRWNVKSLNDRLTSLTFEICS